MNEEVWAVPQGAVVGELAGVMRSKCAVVKSGQIWRSVFPLLLVWSGVTPVWKSHTTVHFFPTSKFLISVCLEGNSPPPLAHYHRHPPSAAATHLFTASRLVVFSRLHRISCLHRPPDSHFNSHMCGSFSPLTGVLNIVYSVFCLWAGCKVEQR